MAKNDPHEFHSVWLGFMAWSEENTGSEGEEMNDEITRADIAKAFVLAVPATLIGLGFFGFIGFVLYMIGA